MVSAEHQLKWVVKVLEVISFIVLVVILPLVMNEISELSPFFAAKIIKWTAYQLPLANRVRYQEEWLAELDEVPGKLLKLVFPFRLVWSLPQMQHELYGATLLELALIRNAASQMVNMFVNSKHFVPYIELENPSGLKMFKLQPKVVVLSLFAIDSETRKANKMLMQIALSGVITGWVFSLLGASFQTKALSLLLLISADYSDKYKDELRRSALYGEVWLQMRKEFPDLNIVELRRAYFKVVKEKEASHNAHTK